ASAAPALPLVERVAVPTPAPGLGADPLRERRLRGVFGLERHHAAGGIAVQGRAGAAEDLGTAQVGELDVGELALAVGQRLRDPIEQNLDAPHAEVRAGAEAADRD